MHRPLPRFHPAPILLAVSFAFSLPAMAQPPSGPDSRVTTIAIAAQSLGAALNELSAATGTPIAFSPALVAGKSAPAVRGTLTAYEAAAQLLRGSGLAAVQDGRTIVIAPAPSASEATLTEVKVTAESTRDGVTEGSGTYRAAHTSTATKLSLSPRETPQTITVVTRQQMDDFSMTSVDQALQSVSGVVVNNQAASNYYYSRGFQMQQQYDGVANPSGISNTFNPTIDSAFIDHIDALQGAAGLMAGAGQPGGVINIVRKRPTEDFQAKAEVQIGSWNQKRIVGDVSGPLLQSGKIRGRLVAVGEDKDSFVDYTWLKRQGLYGVIDADFSSTTKVSVGMQYQHDKSNGSLGVPMASDGSDLGLARSTYLGDPNASQLRTYSLYSIALEQQLTASWKAQIALQHSSNDAKQKNYGFLGGAVNKATGGGLSFYGGSNYENPSRYDALDLSVQGPVRLFERTHELALGISGSEWKNNQDGLGYTLTGVPISNVYTFDPASLPAFNPSWTYSQGNTTRQMGAYAVGRFEITNKLKTIIGLRSTWYKAQSAYQNSLGTKTGSQQTESGVVTPYAGLTYDLNSEYSAYVSYSDIFNPSTYRGTNGYLKPTVGKNYEMGVKGELLEKRLNVAAAIFRLEQTNLAQQDASIPFNATNVCGGYCYTAAGKVLSQGVDLSANGEVHPDWNLSAGYTYVDSEYVSGANDGQRFMTTLPQHSLRFAVNHRLATTGWTLGGSLRVQSEIYNAASRYLIKQGGYAVFGVTAKYTVNPKADLLLNVDNLFDKHYFTSVYGLNYVPYGEPRRVSATLRYRF